MPCFRFIFLCFTALSQSIVLVIGFPRRQPTYGYLPQCYLVGQVIVSSFRAAAAYESSSADISPAHDINNSSQDHLPTHEISRAYKQVYDIKHVKSALSTA
jgi:hypothetical protein